jgi:predicted AAA+ superfamily ATPase
MEILFETQKKLVRNLGVDFQRSLLSKLPWDERAIMLFGARGSGKTTLFLQHLKETYKQNEALYITLDDIYFRQHTLVETAREFAQNNGKILLLDEVHKYPEWSREIKNIYDLLPELKLLITGSSILELQKSGADLSRRVLNFHLPELSFREFLGIKYGFDLPVFSFDEIIKNHENCAEEIIKIIDKPLFYFKQYLDWGAYPIFKETKYVHQRLKQTINLIIDTDLPSVVPIEFSTLNQVKKLLYIIAQSVPFTPNITKLASQIGCNRTKLYEMLAMLSAAKLIYGLYHNVNNSSILNKPEKIFLHNTNLMFALSEKKPEVGTLRETFFINMIESASHKITYTAKGDFKVNEKYVFEIGGKNKTNAQTKELSNAFLAKDEIETGYNNSIPLWLFGFMY